ncbi:MAG: hypothetical protein ACT4R6_09890 [Gemmatimonadaceae bacterium]
MSNPEPVIPDGIHSSALYELEGLVHTLGEELSAFRRRAQHAESRVKTLESAAQGGDLFGEQRVRVLEDENAALRAKAVQATERIRVLLAQLRFLRQQREQAVQAMAVAEK